jgi:hypothetical protein
VVFPIPPRYTKKDILFLKQVIEAGKYRAVIDRCYPLEQVIDATRYAEREQKTGKVVLTLGGDSGPERAIDVARSIATAVSGAIACGALPNRTS